MWTVFLFLYEFFWVRIYLFIFIKNQTNTYDYLNLFLKQKLIAG